MSEASLPESIRVTLHVVRLLEKLGVAYVIGGSLASAIHGVVRTTMDVDIVAAIEAKHIKLFVEALGDGFYADEQRLLDAVNRVGSFNLIDHATMFKVDIFVVKDQVFEISQLERRELVELTESSNERAYVSTPEDVILAKLNWYRKGGEVSDRQWRDILGVIRVQSGKLDSGYLSQMADTMQIEDLLRRAFDETGD